MKIGVQICNHRAMFRKDAIPQFCIIFRSASFSSCWRSQEALQVRPPSCPSSFSHPRMFGLAYVRPSCPIVGLTSRLMSSRPPPFENRREVVSLTDEEKMTLVKAEYELYKAEGEIDLPSHINEERWLEMARLHSVPARKRYLRFLFLTEMKKINKKRKNLEKSNYAAAQYNTLMEELNSEEGYLSYGLWRNSIFMKWSNQMMDKVASHRVLQANLYGQHIVFDLDFDKHMVLREKKVLAKQISECIGRNRSHIVPFYIHMCNFNLESDTAKPMLKAIPTLLDEDFLVDVHSKDYLDVFPKEKLVYLTPHCREEMDRFDHDAVYVIGSLVDTRCNQPLTLAKAKKQNIKMQKLPLDRYLDWGIGNKSLPLNQVLGILLEVKRTGSWTQAFARHIPARKLIKSQEVDAAAIKKKMRGPKYKPEIAGRLVRSWFKD